MFAYPSLVIYYTAVEHAKLGLVHALFTMSGSACVRKKSYFSDILNVFCFRLQIKRVNENSII